MKFSELQLGTQFVSILDKDKERHFIKIAPVYDVRSSEFNSVELRNGSHWKFLDNELCMIIPKTVIDENKECDLLLQLCFAINKFEFWTTVQAHSPHLHYEVSTWWNKYLDEKIVPSIMDKLTDLERECLQFKYKVPTIG